MAKRRPAESVSGSYAPVPHVVLDSASFIALSHRGKAMLFELLRQHKGNNNGHLQLSIAWLKKRGWKSVDQIQKAKQELLDQNLVIKTRLGGLNAGPDRYALTWLDISNFIGLDVRAAEYHKGAWALLDSTPLGNQGKRSVFRSSSVPSGGAATPTTVPSCGTNIHKLPTATNPPSGNNECCQLSARKKPQRVIGKKGHSGVHMRRSAG